PFLAVSLDGVTDIVRVRRIAALDLEDGSGKCKLVLKQVSLCTQCPCLGLARRIICDIGIPTPAAARCRVCRRGLRGLAVGQIHTAVACRLVDDAQAAAPDALALLVGLAITQVVVPVDLEFVVAKSGCKFPLLV